MFDCRGCLIRRVKHKDDRCYRCSTRHLRDIPASPHASAQSEIKRKFCNRGCGAAPLAGMAWCGQCAIKANEAIRGQSEDEDKRINARIAYFKNRGAGEESIGA